jgi:hypothetical protein
MGYRGVSYHKRDSYYRVKLKRNGIEHFLIGAQTLKNAEVAARIYDVAARYLHGPDAILNFDGDPPPGMTRTEILDMLMKTLQNKGIPSSTLFLQRGM